MVSTNNELSKEKSVYLKQHSTQPIKWMTFSKEALDLARTSGKPIFISIGYSSCHWCHTMAKETFQNETIASYLNEYFISIKIDKEEYPDLDHHFQQAAQLFVGSGGWPLNVFTFADLKPFFAGAYYPPFATSTEQTGFFELISELKRVFTEESKEARENALKAVKEIEKGFMPEGNVEFDGHFPHPMSIFSATTDFMDNEFGGFGNSPKFPQFPFLEWSVEQILEGMLEQKETDYVKLTINNILLGGIFDQARGGIHRYSTDQQWQVPHFEKMLYDQSGLLKVLSKYCLIEPTPIVFDAIYNTLDYLEKEMLNEEEQFFFSAQDSDSENVEGLYFTFSDTEFEDVINSVQKNNPELKIDNQFEKIIEWFQITKQGNLNGQNVISMAPQFIEEYKKEDNWTIIRKIREEIIDQRKKRIPPATDPKGIASWNFLLLSSLIDVIQFCPIVPIRQKATLLFNNLVEGSYKNFVSVQTDKKGSLISHTNSVKNDLLYFEDYVFFTEAQLRLGEITSNPIFFKNFKDSIAFIKETFITCDYKIFQSINLNNQMMDYPEIFSECFDYSYKSPLSTYLQLLRRYKILYKSEEYDTLFEELKKGVINNVLKNPMNSGEALRALTYPNDSFRTLEVPNSWIEKEEFLTMIPYFLHRFTITYHDKKTEDFQICSNKSCEISGSGINEFKTKLMPE